MTDHGNWLEERSLWQVLGVYLAGSWVAFEIVATLTESLGLPAWLPRGAIALIAIGLPLVTTAVLLRRRHGLLSLRGALIMGPVAFASLLAAGWVVSVTRDASEPDTDAAGVPNVYATLDDDPRPAIAVLPFADMSPDGDQAYFSDGISEEILGVLSRIRDLRVASRSSALRYRDRDQDPVEIGAALGVPYLLAGSVRRDGENLRISAELVNADDGFRLWSQTYDRRLENVFAIQTEIAEAIARELSVPLGLNTSELLSATLDVAAHDLFLSGRAALRRRGPGVREAITLFEQALARDSSWAPAWAALAEARAIHPLYTGDGRESRDPVFWADNLDAGVRAARRALALDPRNAAARIALGGIYRDRWNWADAESELLEALALDPDNPEAHIQYGEFLWAVGRLDESLGETGRALEMDRTPLTYDIHGFALYMNGRFEEAAAALEAGLALDSAGDMHFLRTVYANQLLMLGRYQEGLDRFGDYLPDTAAYRAMGEALAAGDPNLVPDADVRGLSQTWALLGETERALDALEKLVFAMPFRVQYDVWDPFLADLRETDRFQNVVLPRLRLEGVEPTYAPPDSGG